MIKDIKKPVVKSLNSFKEIGKDFKSGLDKRADKALDSPYDFANYLTLGAVDGIWSGAKGRADKMRNIWFTGNILIKGLSLIMQ